MGQVISKLLQDCWIRLSPIVQCIFRKKYNPALNGTIVSIRYKGVARTLVSSESYLALSVRCPRSKGQHVAVIYTRSRVLLLQTLLNSKQ